ncbi:MAG: glycosyl transferase, partial [Chthoniobacteraceae bacterium]
MSDFAQAGLICTLQRLAAGHGPQLEAELEEIATGRPIILVLPCHGGELGQPALFHLREELRGARWLSEVVVSMNRLCEDEWREARGFFGDLPQPVRMLWNDGPELGPLIEPIRKGALHGKGLNLWSGIGAAACAHPAGVVLTQDCDVLSFQRE